MRRPQTWLPAALGLCLVLALALVAAARGDWPRYRGPKGDGIAGETGLLKSWPGEGPRVLWRARLGSGYSGMAVAGGRVFTLFGNGSDEVAAAFEAASGKPVWRARVDSERRDEMGGGPRATPTIDGELVFAHGAGGKLVAFEAVTGKVRWSVDLVSEHGSRVPQWGSASSPIVDGNLLLVTAGGPSGRALLGLDKRTGKLVWSAESDEAGYSTPVIVEAGGARQALFFAGTSLISVSPQRGQKYWSVPWRTSYDVNAAMPVFIAPDKVFISSSYDVGAQLLRLVSQGGKPAAQVVWTNRVMKNHFNSSVYYQGHLYGFDDATLKCVEPLTATERWKQRGFGKGSLLVADDHLWVLSDRGELALVEATPEAYREKARAQVIEGKTWTMPTIDGKRLFVRSERELIALDVAGKD
jgi:outer membrane protein assembly factor BamB